VKNKVLDKKLEFSEHDRSEYIPKTVRNSRGWVRKPCIAGRLRKAEGYRSYRLRYKSFTANFAGNSSRKRSECNERSDRRSDRVPSLRLTPLRFVPVCCFSGRLILSLTPLYGKALIQRDTWRLCRSMV